MGERELVRYRTFLYDSDRWRDFVFRPGDIVISSPPKCGTTWMQMICALLVLQEPILTQPLSVHSPWLDLLTRARRDVVADLKAQRHRRFIKTHTPLDGLPLGPSVTYVCVGRDPRDVALSWDNHLENIDFAAIVAALDAAATIDGITPEPMDVSPWADSALQRFWLWADDDTPPAESLSSLLRILHHLRTFWDAPDSVDAVMLHYDDLRADLESQMRILADRLTITVPEHRWPALVNAASFDEMRAQAALTAPNAHKGTLRDHQRFFNRGTSGQWRDLLNNDDLGRYRERVNAIGPLDVVDWVHRRSL
ncbi:MAG: sulfotransferase domain-containing protein [Pseudonocardiales bacterium]|nr:sulfotransferase domain-containing protein [Pseudonocardiales bacterium]